MQNKVTIFSRSFCDLLTFSYLLNQFLSFFCQPRFYPGTNNIKYTLKGEKSQLYKTIITNIKMQV